MEKEQYLEVYRHSLAHILAKAVIELYGKEVQYAIGPQIADGFYYDFTFPAGVSVSAENFPEIENKMREIIKRREDWKRVEISKAEASEIFASQKFKKEIIDGLSDDETITAYWTGDDYIDLCRGPHVDNSQELMGAAFELRSVSGAYWRGDE
ncbi:MAG TPA: threonine--tRNA ligase, partial [Ruminococcaceae bacterium]|nr:threonine--tRNA ligase [Oscillospiraceae bacterium]